ncbi:MAG: hypothetical protein IPJ65_03615 [Archangiaceae bacterium]|nr:hypothetical protein [Archangiaceae bacterium]
MPPDAGGTAGGSATAGGSTAGGTATAGGSAAGGSATAGGSTAGGAAGGTAGGTVACGAAGLPCCAGAACGAALVCATSTCVQAVVPHACGAATGVVFVSEVAPPSTLPPYAALDTTLTFANCSTQTWTAAGVNDATGYKLGFDGPRDQDTWGMSRVALPASVPPGNAVTVAVHGRAPPLTGPHGYRWSILREGVAWLSGASPLHGIEVKSTRRDVALCAGVTADIGGELDAAPALQRCVDATPSGGALEVPAGVYRMGSALELNHPMTLRTAGTAAVSSNCFEPGGPACAIFRADANLSAARGFLRFGPTTDVTLDHVVLDGNRGARLGSAAAATCAGGSNGAGFNAGSGGCTRCAFTHGGSARALCGTGWEWTGDHATIRDCVFRDNGQHTATNMWSDGLTLLQSNGATVTGNMFVDNSDVDFIFGGGTGATVSDNFVSHLGQAAFAGLMLDNFNGGTSGDFTGTVVSGNFISCGAQLCDFAIELGPHPWYPSANIIGGTVSGNTAVGGKFNLNAEGAGTVAAPITVTGNTLGGSPASAHFNCGTRSSTAFNVSPDSHVSLGSGPAPTGSLTFHSCP